MTEKDSGPDGTGWICDRCGELIQRATEGALIWLSDKDTPCDGRRMRIVHHDEASPLRGKRKCDPGYPWTMQHLDTGLGPDGLMRLLVFIAEETAPREDILYTIQRLHLPHFERASRHIDSALDAGVIQPNLPKGFYWQDQLESILAYYQS